MKNAALLSSLATACLAVGGLAAPAAAAPVAGDELLASDDERVRRPDTRTAGDARVIELAICLDTSGSMDGLINSARQKLWTIVNDLAEAVPTPRLRVALLSYGNDGHDAENGWVAVETPFTEDLDVVSQKLFGLTTNGGTELVGRVLQTALQELDWHDSDRALRMVFVAGNESAHQDEQVAVRTLCDQATARGIDVNAIYCVYGDDDSEVRPGWRELAGLGHGEFAMIDQDHGTLVIATPYDPALIELSAELNETYIPFGAAGEAGCSNQAAQDANALGLNTANAASRAATKAGKLYSCGSWDLVDAVRNGELDLAEVAEADLPEDMRALTHAERVTRVATMQQRRTELQSRINQLDRLRRALLEKELARQATTNVGSFDLAIRSAIRTKAEAKDFTFTPLGAPVVGAMAEAMAGGTAAGAAVVATPAAEVIVAEVTAAVPTAGATPGGATAAIATSPAENLGTFEFFVQFAGGSMSTWVANDIVVDFEDARRSGRDFEHDVHVIPGTPEAEAFIGTLPTRMQDLVRSLQGAIYLRWLDRIHLVTGGC